MHLISKDTKERKLTKTVDPFPDEEQTYKRSFILSLEYPNFIVIAILHCHIIIKPVSEIKNSNLKKNYNRFKLI